MARSERAVEFGWAVAAQTAGTLLAAAVIGLAATLSGRLSYNARFTGEAVQLVITFAGFWGTLVLARRATLRRWERAVLVLVAFIGPYLVGALVAGVVIVSTRQFNG